MAIKLLPSSSESVEVTEMASAVNYILAQTKGEEGAGIMKKALSLAEVYAREHGMDVRAVQRAVAMKIARDSSEILLKGQRERSALFDAAFIRIEDKRREMDALLIASRAGLNAGTLALLRSELAREKREENSILVPEKDIRTIKK